MNIWETVQIPNPLHWGELRVHAERGDSRLVNVVSGKDNVIEKVEEVLRDFGFILNRTLRLETLNKVRCLSVNELMVFGPLVICKFNKGLTQEQSESNEERQKHIVSSQSRFFCFDMTAQPISEKTYQTWLRLSPTVVLDLSAFKGISTHNSICSAREGGECFHGEEAGVSERISWSADAPPVGSGLNFQFEDLGFGKTEPIKAATSAEKQLKATSSVSHQIAEEKLDSIRDAGKRYKYIPETETYLFSILKPDDVALPSEVVANMYLRYSKHGENCTIQELSRELGLPRPVTVKIKDRLGLVKDSLPYPPEMLEDTEDSVVMSTLLESRELRLLRARERIEERLLEKKYKDLDDYKNWFGHRLTNLNETLKSMASSKPLVLREGKSKLTAFWSMHDEHWGKKPYNDSAYTIDDQYEEMMRASDKIVARLAEREVDEVVTIFGSDAFHVDSKNKTTLRGTPQDMMCTVGEMTDRLLAYFTYSVNKASQVAPVRIYVVAGNHDATATEIASRFLKHIYRDNPRVSVEYSDRVRKYHAIGDTLLVMHHGDYNVKNLEAIISNESQALYPLLNFKRKVIVSGHRHVFELKMNSHSDVIYSTATSPSKCDEWTHKNYGESLDRNVSLYFIRESGPLESIDFVAV